MALQLSPENLWKEIKRTTDERHKYIDEAEGETKTTSTNARLRAVLEKWRGRVDNIRTLLPQCSDVELWDALEEAIKILEYDA